MKKVFIFLAVLLVAGSALFAEKKSTMKVEAVVGKVTYEVSNGEWADLKNGMVIDANASISTGLNSTLTVNIEGKSVTIKPMKKGKIDEILASSSSKTGVKIGSLVTSAEIADAAENSKRAVVTASSRASEAKTDLEWEE